MVSLRHLEIEGTSSLEYLPKGLGRISGLRSLCKFIVGGGGEGCRIDELQRLNSLRESIKIIHLERVSSQEEAEKAQLWNKQYLRRLVLWKSRGREDDDAEMDGMSDGRDDDDAVTDGMSEGRDDDDDAETDGMSEGRDGDNAEMERRYDVLEGLRPHVNLEELTVYDYRGSRLPSWMDVMRRLRKLEISGCIELRSLPDSLGQLESLEHLRISSCKTLESLPDSFGQLKALNRLEISYCHALGSLPDSFGQLKALNHLEISGCDALRSLPDSFGQLNALNHLQISGCHALRLLPDGLQHLPLRELRINACPLLSERCKRDGGEDWPKISHISNITIEDWQQIQ